MNKTSGKNHQGLSNLSKESDDVADYYNEWAPEYDTNLADWDYKTPTEVASILRSKLPEESQILDAGCGTGLSGKALQTAGFSIIDGIDISEQSLEKAHTTKAYRSLQKANMQQLPLSIPTDKYDGLVCVGVLTYLTNSADILREFCRVVKSQGLVVITQRNDLMIERNFRSVLEELSGEDVISHLKISEPLPYLPENEEFSDKILVHHIEFSVV